MRIDEDRHVHPFQGTRNLDGMRDFAEAAIVKGLRAVCFTEHAPLPGWADASRHFLTEAELDRYIACAERLRDEYRGRLAIHIGLEADYHPRMHSHLRRLLSRYDWAHVGGSVHLHLPYWGDGIPQSESERTGFALALTREAVDSGFFHGINHLDFFRWHSHDYDPSPHREAYDALFARMVEKDVALELNTSGLSKEFRDMLPCVEVWKWSLAYPLKRCYGSDAHIPEQVAQFFERIYQPG